MTLATGDTALSESLHDEFQALCALSTAGALTPEEQGRLAGHLEQCPSCREASRQYSAIVSAGIPALGPVPDNLEQDASWSQDRAETALFERLAREEEGNGDRREAGKPIGIAAGKLPVPANHSTRKNVWVLIAAGILLSIALSISAYEVGIHRGVKSAVLLPLPAPTKSQALELQVSDLGHERELLHVRIDQREAEISSLRQQLERETAEIGKMQLAQTQLQADLRNDQAGRQALLLQQSDLNSKLDAARASTQELQMKLDLLQQQSSGDHQRANLLEAKVADLTAVLRERDATIDQQQELLAHDRDIRELMGARDLYIAEVYDVARDGQTKKPYGRVFYTKGKSLIFYAYDLDQQNEIKNASTFQVWGRRGPDRKQAVNLGVLYEDSASKKRWVLRFDDPKTLAQIDAVFVTVEPDGRSHRPTGKPLLFAYLKIEPNHP